MFKKFRHMVKIKSEPTKKYLSAEEPEPERTGDDETYGNNNVDILISKLLKRLDGIRNIPAGEPLKTEVSANLPLPVNIDSFIKNPIPLMPELIGGVLRIGQKMIVTAGSKTGKSFLVMELAMAIATGRDWLGFPCIKGKVLYVNFEIQDASCGDRFLNILQAKGIETTENNLHIWNLRGQQILLKDLVEPLVQLIKKEKYIAVILDPIYKISGGDENSAKDVSALCNDLDAVARQGGCACIYVHHHSKGAQTGKNAMDRGSGSGVFSRDADAIVDIMPLGDFPNDDLMLSENAVPCRAEFTLRDFEDPGQINFFFKYPIHILDTQGVLENAEPKSYSSKSKKEKDAKIKTAMDSAFEKLPEPVRLSDMARAMNRTEATMRTYIKKFPEYSCKNSVVTRKMYENEVDYGEEDV